MSAYPPIAELLPHVGEMVLLDALTHWEKGRACCTLSIREGAPFVRDGRVPNVVTLEYMAQGVAACFGYEALLGGDGVKVGMIVGCKRFVAHGSHLTVGQRGQVDVAFVSGNDLLSHFDCKLWTGAALFSQAVLTLYHAAQPPQ